MTSDAAGKDILPSNTESASFVDSAGATVNKAGSSIPFSSITAGGVPDDTTSGTHPLSAPETIVIGDDGDSSLCDCVYSNILHEHIRHWESWRLCVLVLTHAHSCACM